MDTLKSPLEEITITSYKALPITKNSLVIINLSMDSISNTSGFNLTHNLLKINGLSMLSTGLGIAKPVIRGLYGNRVLVLMNGLRFDNQQWQDEHGLGLTGFGLSNVEVIKGPLGILYGSEAMGGIINLIDERKANLGKSQSDYSIQANSNTRGGMIQAGFKKNNGKNWWRFRIGLDNHGDYSDGNNIRVLNSRFDGYYMKSTYGFDRGRWTSNNNLYSSMNRFGFIFNDVYNFIIPDKRWSRVLSDFPSHRVFLNIFSSENTIKFNNGSFLNVNFGIQSNRRQENEGSGAISLDMHLLTFQTLSKFTMKYSEKHRFTFSNLNAIETNTNYGARKIIPDAFMQESNLSVHHEFSLNNHLVIENGFGVGQKIIRTTSTPTVNDNQKEIKPFSKFSFYYNFLSGLSYLPNNEFNFKANVATGVRVANLAELSSDGLHEGIFTYEIGNPNLKNEQVFSLNLASNWKINKWEVSLSPFYNYFYNYIYLAPVAEEWFGFPVYRYIQGNTRQYGFEASIGYEIGQDCLIKIEASRMKSIDANGHYTTFIPAAKITPSFSYKFNFANKIPVGFNTNLNYNFAQIDTSPLEKATPDYVLWNGGLTTHIFKNDNEFAIGLYINNILNTSYYDHLSRLKNYGLLNIGRNISINLKITL